MSNKVAQYESSILVIDESPAQLKLIFNILSEAGYKVFPVLNGELALKFLQKNSPDLILLDSVLPKISGYEVCKQIKTHERTRDIPVVFLSALQDVQDRVQAFDVGGIDYITKPFGAEELLARINTHITISDLQKQLGAFSYSISHDLRAPLRAIAGFSNMLINDNMEELSEAGQNHVNRIVESAQKMTVLIDSLLLLSKLGNQKTKMESIDLTAYAKKICEELKEDVPHRKIELKIGEVPKSMGDPNLIEIMFTNLIENTIKFTREKEVSVIEFGHQVEDNQTIYFFRDNGVGFNTDYADKLFQPFQRLHSSNEYEGVGIGLSIVQRIVKRHKGRIWVESSVGNGSTFYFTLG